MPTGRSRRSSLPYDYPVGATAVRPQWSGLPLGVRHAIEGRCGAPVREARSVPTGFTAGFASRLTLTDGSRVFVKAAGVTGDRWRDHNVEAYAEEAAKLVLLPPEVPAPALRWTWHGDIDGREWVLLCFDDIGGRPPHRPWQEPELDRVLDCLERTADALTPAPPGSATTTFADDFADEAERWSTFAYHPVAGGHAEEARELAVLGLAGAAGDSLVHADLRDDNVVIDAEDRVWICDWNWPLRGAPWIDSLTLLISARGDGIDTDGLLARRHLTAGVEAAVLDGFLALLAGYWLAAQDEPVPPSSPWLRAHQRWHAEVTWAWLAERRRWS